MHSNTPTNNVPQVRYRVLTQKKTFAKNGRRPWGDRNAPTTATIVTASAMEMAIYQVHEAKPKRKVVSVEEVGPVVWFSDEELTKALLESEQPGYELRDDQSVYESSDFTYTVQGVITGLCDSGLLTGLSLSLNENDDYAMIEAYVCDNQYRATGVEIKNLTDDHNATGWDGVLAIARAVVRLASDVI